MRKKILAVDDDSLNLAIMEELLGDEFELITASSGEEALQLAAKLHPDLVLLDIMMPGMDGYEACRQIRADESLMLTKVILLSAKAMISERLRGYEAGADDYVTKPFDHMELVAKIHVYLRLRSMEEINHLKTEFMTLAAHETRTPLSQLISLSEILAAEQDITREQREKFMTMLRQAIERLQVLMDRGLQFCALRAGKAELRPSTFDLGRVVRELAESWGPKATANGMTLALDGPVAIEMESDEAKVRQALDLILESALTRGAGGPAAASLTSDAAMATFELRAPAAGMAAESVALLMEPFRTADLNHHGHGGVIGLPLAAELVRYLQGDTRLSVTPEQVLLVQVRLPRKTQPALPEAEEQIHRAAA